MELKGKKRVVGFRFAWAGLKSIIRKESNFQLHLLATVIVFVLGIFLQLSLIEWAIISLTVGLVLVAEMINSAVERIMDFIEPGYHETVKMVKDISAGAVLVAAVISVIVGLLILGPKLIQMM